MKELIPLIGVLVGWFLGQLAAIFSQRGVRRRTIGKWISFIYDINHEMRRLPGSIDMLKGKVPWKKYEEKRVWAVKRYCKLEESDIKRIDEMVIDISSYYPLIGYRLKAVFEGHKFNAKMDLSSTAGINPELYVRLLSTYEVAFEFQQKELEKILLMLCWRHGLLTWWPIRRNIRAYTKNSEAILKTPFMQATTDMVDEVYFGKTSDKKSENEERGH